MSTIMRKTMRTRPLCQVSSSSSCKWETSTWRKCPILEAAFCNGHRRKCTLMRTTTKQLTSIHQASKAIRWWLGILKIRNYTRRSVPSSNFIRLTWSSSLRIIALSLRATHLLRPHPYFLTAMGLWPPPPGTLKMHSRHLATSRFSVTSSIQSPHPLELPNTRHRLRLLVTAHRALT